MSLVKVRGWPPGVPGLPPVSALLILRQGNAKHLGVGLERVESLDVLAQPIRGLRGRAAAFVRTWIAVVRLRWLSDRCQLDDCVVGSSALEEELAELVGMEMVLAMNGLTATGARPSRAGWFLYRA